MSSPTALRVVQLSDIHWGGGPSPVDGRDPITTFGHVVDHLRTHHDPPDLYVATGDLTDDGSETAARGLAAALGALDAPVHCLAGNHDSGATLGWLTDAHPQVHAPSSSRHGAWLFCYLDSNAQGTELDDRGVRVDHPDRMHRSARCEVAPEHLAALDALLDATDAEHVMVWVHHPPLMPPAFDAPASRNDGFHALHDVLARTGKVRAVAAGHMHTGFANEHEGIAYLGTVTTWLAMDFDRRVLTAPGYRTFSFEPDGTVRTDHVLIDHDAYPDGNPLPAWVTKIFAEHFGVPLDPA